jgi:hypothetical protein
VTPGLGIGVPVCRARRGTAGESSDRDPGPVGAAQQVNSDATRGTEQEEMRQLIIRSRPPRRTAGRTSQSESESGPGPRAPSRGFRMFEMKENDDIPLHACLDDFKSIRQRARAESDRIIEEVILIMKLS